MSTPDTGRPTGGSAALPDAVDPTAESVPGPTPADVPGATQTPDAAGAEEPLRVLVLVRHAQAKDSSPTGDVGRELTKKGRVGAAELGEWLTGQGLRPDIALVSPATRTRQTWDALRVAGLRGGSLWADRALYEADVEDVVESIQAAPDEARTVVVVGHAPAVPDLARSLPDHREGDVTPLAQCGWPPAGCAVVGHRGPWSTFPAAASAVVAVRLPH